MLDRIEKRALYSQMYPQVYPSNSDRLMVNSNSPSLTPQAQHLLDVLRAAEGWVNRTELARLAQKTALNKWDFVLLEKLTEAELIERRQVPRHGPIGYEWQYRAIDPESGSRDS